MALEEERGILSEILDIRHCGTVVSKMNAWTTSSSEWEWPSFIWKSTFASIFSTNGANTMSGNEPRSQQEKEALFMWIL